MKEPIQPSISSCVHYFVFFSVAQSILWYHEVSLSQPLSLPVWDKIGSRSPRSGQNLYPQAKSWIFFVYKSVFSFKTEQQNSYHNVLFCTSVVSCLCRPVIKLYRVKYLYNFPPKSVKKNWCRRTVQWSNFTVHAYIWYLCWRLLQCVCVLSLLIVNVRCPEYTWSTCAILPVYLSDYTHLYNVGGCRSPVTCAGRVAPVHMCNIACL